jgi:ABC-type multidrug transport system fused ATPase/permease subunit
VNGEPAQAYDSNSWQSEVSFVPQEPELIHGTVAENIGFFREGISDDHIRRAVEAVGLADLVASLPEGISTLIGPTVHNFSGGQKQRIGIARALVGNPSLFVLDEPTSALDEESEGWVMRTLGELRQNRFVIVITHRQTTLQHCDTIIQMDHGRIVSTYSH